MSMDKSIGWNEFVVADLADYNWVQTNVTVLDNSAGVIPKTIRSIFVNAQCYPTVADKYYYAIMLVTSQDSAVPNFAGDTSALNTALYKYRDLIWTTQSGVVKFGAIPDDAMIPFEPKTGRKLEPGQKLVFIMLARNCGTASAGNLISGVDWNIWFDY